MKHTTLPFLLWGTLSLFLPSSLNAATSGDDSFIPPAPHTTRLPETFNVRIEQAVTDGKGLKVETSQALYALAQQVWHLPKAKRLNRHMPTGHQIPKGYDWVDAFFEKAGVPQLPSKTMPLFLQNKKLLSAEAAVTALQQGKPLFMGAWVDGKPTHIQVAFTTPTETEARALDKTLGVTFDRAVSPVTPFYHRMEKKSFGLAAFLRDDVLRRTYDKAVLFMIDQKGLPLAVRFTPQDTPYIWGSDRMTAFEFKPSAARHKESFMGTFGRKASFSRGRKATAADGAKEDERDTEASSSSTAAKAAVTPQKSINPQVTERKRKGSRKKRK